MAFKKTFPGIHSLNLNCSVIGYARSKLTLEDWTQKVTSKIAQPNETFVKNLHYISGQYDSESDFERLADLIKQLEGPEGGNRLFYLAIPPSQFANVATTLHQTSNYSKGKGWNRIIIEKPFGHDLDSSNLLSLQLKQSKWLESEIYRIDHYLGKLVVKSILPFRQKFNALWSNQYISKVDVAFKESFGTEGRGGYFDEIGIIRDVIQNHLLQIVTIVGMELPSTNANRVESIRDAKVQVLKHCSINSQDVILGQYVGKGDKLGYKQDSTVPKDSKTPTFASMKLLINTPRWQGTPFHLSAGKALDESTVSVTLHFKDMNLVFRVQPNEAIYFEMTLDKPVKMELDFKKYEKRIPDAYEALIGDCIKGDASNFVRGDELEYAWRLFTPLLHDLEHVVPREYEYGSRGPIGYVSILGIDSSSSLSKL